jgi:putative selenate reductase
MSGAHDLDELRLARARRSGFAGAGPGAAAYHNLARYAERVLEDPAYHRATYHRPGSRSTRALEPLDCIEPPCTATCAIDQDVPGYLRRIAAGDAAGAAEVIRRDNPLPVILGRACHHPCETECVRTHYDEPVAIRDLKRFAMEGAPPPRGDTGPASDLRVAVIGAGPCGLAAAWELRRVGAKVTVLDASDEAGGMVSATIPRYRAGDAAIRRDLDALERAGVTVEHGRRLGADLDLEELRERGFAAVVLAVGAARGRRLWLAGEDATGVWDGLHFLRRARRGGEVAIGRRVGVVGGGDVAVDCARTATRLGAEVAVIYRRQAAHSPAHPEDLRALAEEGIVLRELLSPLAIECEDGVLRAVLCQRMRPGKPGDDGRPRPEPVPGDTVRLELDSLVVAVGQAPDPEALSIVGLRVDDAGRVVVDPATGRTTVDGLWAGGDVVRGPSSIVEAAGDGRLIALDIASRAGLCDVAPEATVARSPSEVELARLLALRASRVRRRPAPRATAAGELGFDELVRTYDDDDARAEAARCLECDLLCSLCVTACPNRALFTYAVEPFAVSWPALGAGPDALFERAVSQPYQVALVDDWCNACGNCVEFCPTAGRPHADKPRLMLDDATFAADGDDAILVRWRAGELELVARQQSVLHRMTWGDRVTYRGPGADAELDPDSAAMLAVHRREGAAPGEAPDWSPCLTLLALGRGLRRGAPGLLAAVRRRAGGTGS